MSAKNEDDNSSLALKLYSPPPVEDICLEQSDVPSRRHNEAGAPSYECSTGIQGKYGIIPP